MNRQRSTRSSRGSRGSNSNVSEDSDPREKMKDCCRKLAAFMFTQVGVGGVIVGYALCGAAVFQAIEKEYVNTGIENATTLRTNIAEKIWNVTEQYNMLNQRMWTRDVEKIMLSFQGNYTEMVRNGLETREPKDIWSYPAALMFCLSVFSMIGYGNTLPKTVFGKIMTMIYATFGIPLYILYFMNMGKVLAATFKWLYTWFHECSHDQDKDNSGSEQGSTVALPKTGRKKVIVPSSTCLWVMTFFIIGGTVMFSEWEKWAWYDALYFVVISLCKIGFGDLVPGSSLKDDETSSNSKLVINFVFILFGMGLVAMCYKLMREEVREKFREIKEDTKMCMEDVTQKFAKCFGSSRDDEFDESKFDHKYAPYP